MDPARFTSAGMWAAPPDRWEDDTPETLLLREEARVRLEKAIADLPPLQRAVVTLHDIDGLDSATVCHTVEISEANQRTSLHRARSKIRSALERTHQPVVDSARGSRAARHPLAPTAPDLPWHRPGKRELLHSRPHP